MGAYKRTARFRDFLYAFQNVLEHFAETYLWRTQEQELGGHRRYEIDEEVSHSLKYLTSQFR